LVCGCAIRVSGLDNTWQHISRSEKKLKFRANTWQHFFRSEKKLKFRASEWHWDLEFPILAKKPNFR